jgi:hypothetical protein
MIMPPYLPTEEIITEQEGGSQQLCAADAVVLLPSLPLESLE